MDWVVESLACIVLGNLPLGYLAAQCLSFKRIIYTKNILTRGTSESCFTQSALNYGTMKFKKKKQQQQQTERLFIFSRKEETFRN